MRTPPTRRPKFKLLAECMYICPNSFQIYCLIHVRLNISNLPFKFLVKRLSLTEIHLLDQRTADYLDRQCIVFGMRHAQICSEHARLHAKIRVQEWRTLSQAQEALGLYLAPDLAATSRLPKKLRHLKSNFL